MPDSSATTTRAPQTAHIRTATAADAPALSRICLLTADAGQSAEHQHTFGELPGAIYAEPYVKLRSAKGWVLVEREEGGEEAVVGYVLTGFDTATFEKELEEDWFPAYRAKYPHPFPPSRTPAPLAADIRYMETIHAPQHASPVSLAFSPAHLHIDILPSHQRRGYGRTLIGSVVRWLQEEKGLEGVWLGMDPRNVEAARFYEKLGFRELEGAPKGVVGLKFSEWRW